MRFTPLSTTRDVECATSASSSARGIALGTAVELEPHAIGDGGHVLVAPSGEIDEKNVVARQHCRELRRVCQRVARFERRYDAFGAAALVERRHRFVVGHRDVARAAAILEPGVLGADT